MALPEYYPEEIHPDTSLVTEEQYFQREDNSSDRWEFIPVDPPDSTPPRRGIVRMMSGGTLDHSAIKVNLVTTLSNALRAAGLDDCEVYNADLKIHTADGANTYPDASIVCGAPSFYRDRRDIITNPIVVAEVLSPGTEEYDTGAKWEHYQSIPDIQHYLLIAPDRIRVEIYSRSESGWQYRVYEDPASVIPLPGPGISLSIAELYRRAHFRTQPS